MSTLERLADKSANAETRFREAFERLKSGVPLILPKGTPVSQNNVAREAGCDSSALRKARFPLLVLTIQEWVKSNINDQSPSERQVKLKKRRKNRDTRELICDLKMQRDKAVGLLLAADMHILELTEKLASTQAKLDQLQPPTHVLNFSKNKD